MAVIVRSFEGDEVDIDALDQVFLDFHDGQLCRNYLWSWFMSNAIGWADLAHSINRSAYEVDTKIDRDWTGKARI